ncbi:hypothetical protein H0H87_006454 [Tephrocybe sp. NHM501043]|nr:hypothetical protein H0H87_006454 [Tephrocybe sp. NHM501043]
MRKLDIATPSSELVDAYLHEIAKGYSVDWSPPTNLKADVASETEATPTDPDSHTESTPTVDDEPNIKKGDTLDITYSNEPPAKGDLSAPKDSLTKPPPHSSAKPSSASTSAASPKDDFDALMQRFTALKKP